jgi:hypothetical protein
MTARLSACLAIASAIIAASTTSAAEEWGEAPTAMPARARVFLPACELPLFDTEALLGSLRLELLGSGVELIAADGAPEDDSLALLAVEAPGCEPQRLTLRVERPSTGRSATREVDLTDRPPTDWGRVLALSIAELLRGSWAGLAEEEDARPTYEAAAEEPVIAAQPIDEAELRRRVREAVAEIEARRRVSRWPDHRALIGARLELSMLPVHDCGLFGGALLGDVRLARSVPLYLGVDAGYRRGGGSDALGRVVTQTAAGGLELRYQGETRRLRGGLGPRLELGWSRIEGEPIDSAHVGQRADGFALTLGLAAALQVRLSQRLWMVVGLSLGYVLVGLDALSTEHHVGGVAGPVLSTSLGLAFGL